MLGIFMTLSMVPIGGCFYEADMGYPKKVEFSAEGGSENSMEILLTSHMWIEGAEQTIGKRFLQ